MNWLIHLFQKIGGFFITPKALAIEAQLSSMVVAAEPIVKAIAALTPNRTVQEITAAYEKYGVPVAGTIANDPTSTGNALLNLATTILQKNHAPDAAVSLLNTAVQLALTAVKAQA
jgi:hypothetical protein